MAESTITLLYMLYGVFCAFSGIGFAMYKEAQHDKFRLWPLAVGWLGGMIFCVISLIIGFAVMS